MRSRQFLLLFVVVLACAPGTAQADSQVAGDFNGDGLGDLAIGVPEENLAGAGNGGAVSVVYGTPAGLAPAGNQFWSQDSPGIEDAPEIGDRFGHSVAAGDFNGDGFDDMAVGSAREDVGLVVDAGAVNVIYGSAAGLTATGNQFWTQDSLDVEDVAGEGDFFGSSLSAGEVGLGAGEELAIGAPGDDVGSITEAGDVNVLYGSAAGLTAAGDQVFNQDVTDIRNFAQFNEGFGSVVAFGNFNGDGNADLAIAIPREHTGAVRGGAVAVIHGSDVGLTVDDQLWTQDNTGIEDVAEGSDMVRSSLAVGDFNADAHDDLVMGFDGENINPGRISHTGAANVIYGTPLGLSAAGDQFWYQDSPGIEEASEGGDNLAWALTAGDLDGDGDDDLALGARREDLGTIVNAGVVNVIPGSPAGLTDVGDIVISQDSPGVEDDAELNDEFGSALFAGDLNGDGRDELGVGVILEDVGAVADAGVANVFYDTFSSTGLNQLWHQDSTGILDRVEDGDRLGYSLPG